MIEQKEEIERLGGQVLLVTHAELPMLERKMMHDLENPFPLLLDPQKASYRQWGLGKTNLAGSVLSPSLNWRYLKLLLRGERFLGTAPNMFQLGGDFIVDSAGLIAAAHPMRNNGDHVEVSVLLDGLRRLATPVR
ncbi:MAG TPA: AhpC/TSA family protein [Terriglobales bacterium]|nr:AhpC/TSA family protein [Terriglobales bacterium]